MWGQALLFHQKIYLSDSEYDKLYEKNWRGTKYCECASFAISAVVPNKAYTIKKRYNEETADKKRL
jgi:hypothetical protein